MSQLQKFGRLLFAAIMLFCVMAYTPSATQANGGYEFESSSADCGNWLPTDVDLSQRVRGDRYIVGVEFTITQELIDLESCAGSHFNLQIDLNDFSSKADWSSCSVDYEHEYTFGWDIVGDRSGNATATVYGAKFVEQRMHPGYVYWVSINCSDLRTSRHSEPSVSVNYVGTWWSTNLDEPGCEPTNFVTSGTKGPAGLPVCVEYTGQDAWLTNSDGDTEFPFDD